MFSNGVAHVVVEQCPEFRVQSLEFWQILCSILTEKQGKERVQFLGLHS